VYEYVDEKLVINAQVPFPHLTSLIDLSMVQYTPIASAVISAHSRRLSAELLALQDLRHQDPRQLHQVDGPTPFLCRTCPRDPFEFSHVMFTFDVYSAHPRRPSQVPEGGGGPNYAGM
jgi:hypothetical protein